MRDRYSVVIPVFNSETIVGETIDRTIRFFEDHDLKFELILVNDGSTDHSWEILRQKSSVDQRIVAIDLIRNYGQHTAIYCGLRYSSGNYVITLDDDLQNPPEEILHLINKTQEGYDLVFGRFRTKEHQAYRRIGSRLVGILNRKIFRAPDGLLISNFRIIRRDVVNRMIGYRTGYPYIQGLALMFAVNPTNALVEHRPRVTGSSNYNLPKIIGLLMRILFNYSSYPLRLVSAIGILVAGFSFLLGIYFFGRAVLVGSQVPGWPSSIILSSFLNGIVLLILGMLGEYVVRLLSQVSYTEIYHVREAINVDA